MYVKELTIRGFKSFANATTLRFEPGITAIVGPNGSGKSNIVDALSWVMGEQGARSLRGSSMDDVIFAGTSTRAPLGRAQVSLTIDNTDGTLDIEYSEVTISRTIFRNGGSEYAINGTPARLLDVQELLSDTGLGAHMHVVVGQGKLDSIFKATPADNRAFIEEAAGILKHRKRKERALRKLQSTNNNLNRLDDLLKEIQRQLGPLRRQARVSRRADNIQVIIRDATSRLLADEAASLTQQRNDIRNSLVHTREELLHAQRDLTSTKLEIERLEAAAGKSSPAIDAINQVYHAMANVQERLKSLSALAAERAHSYQSQVVAAGGDNPDVLNTRADELENQLAQARQTSDDNRIALEKSTQLRAQIEQELSQSRQMMTQLRKSAQEKEAHKAQLREMIARCEAQIQGFDARRKDLTDQKALYEKSLEEALARLDTLQQSGHSEIEDLGIQLDKAKVHLTQIRESRETLNSQIRDIDNAVISLKAKADALSDTLESRSSSGDLEKSAIETLGNLADYIHIEDGWEEAVAKGLGPFASSVIVSDSLAALQSMELAHTQRMGLATVLYPLHNADSEDVIFPEHSAALVVTVNDTLVGTDKEELACGIVRSVRHLLSDVAVVSTRDEAAELIRTGTFAAVMTADGDTFTAVGAVGGISRTPSDLSLTARRDKALNQVAQHQTEVDKLRENKSALDTQYDHARAEVEKINTAITENRVRIQQREAQIQAAHTSVDGLKQRIAQVDSQIDSIDAQEQSQKASLADLQSQLEIADTSESAHADLDSMSKRETELDAQLTRQRESEVSARLEFNNADQHVHSLERQIMLLRSQAQSAEQRLARIAQQNAKREKQAARAQHIAQSAGQAAQELLTHIDKVLEKRARVQAQASQHDEDLTRLRAKRKSQEPIIEKLMSTEHDLDVMRERVATQFGQIQQRILDELGSTPEQLIESFGPDNPVPVFDENGQLIAREGEDDQIDGVANSDDPVSDEPVSAHYKTEPYAREREQKKLDKAKRDLAALGKVNPLATEEYDALETRHKYLTEQRQDVINSRDDLMGLIKDLDATMIEVFKSAYEDTAEAFQKVFATLFPGGTGRLKLDNPDDLLTTGVIVEASPAGKRVKQLSLLSGGERSLTALALLFAIFTARPSPFYIMDEVEAALDDINLTRLLNAMNDLRAHAQLIVITHQQRTMSIADALYGVTMRSDGVTSVVSQRLKQGAFSEE